MSKLTKSNYPMIDCMKFVAALMVICVHSHDIADQSLINFIIKNILCRVAVPFFFISSAYFIRKKAMCDPGYLHRKIKSLINDYFFWSLLFIPVGLYWINQNMDLSKLLYPIALVFGMAYSGTYYHLWYIPALILSLVVVSKLLKHFSYRAVFSFTSLLYLFGCLETYYGLIPDSAFKHFFDVYIDLFFTTRNGLFYGLIFTAIGFFIYDNEEKINKLKSSFSKLLFIFGILLLLEGLLAYQIKALDRNFMILLIPFCFTLFCLGLNSTIRLRFDTGRLRSLSQYYYFIHPLSIVLFFETGNCFHLNWLQEGVLSFIIIVSFTHCMSLLIMTIKKQRLGIESCFSALILALYLTSYSIFILLKHQAFHTPIESEVIPSIFICFLIILTSLIATMNTQLDKWRGDLLFSKENSRKI